jgi:hypothetical protein
LKLWRAAVAAKDSRISQLAIYQGTLYELLDGKDLYTFRMPRVW